MPRYRAAALILPGHPLHGHPVDLIVEDDQLTGVVPADGALDAARGDRDLGSARAFVGWWDLQADFRDPGTERAEGLDHGLTVAAQGGFAKVAPVASTRPCRDQPADWGWIDRRLPSWRLKVPIDDPEASGDVVLRRADGFIAYQLATVIDELCFGISDVMRGDDLRAALPAQRSLFRALSQPPPRFHHGPLRCDGLGRKLSKREASAGLAPLRDQGLDAPAVVGSLAAGLGLVPVGSRLSAAELLQGLTHDAIRASHS